MYVVFRTFGAHARVAAWPCASRSLVGWKTEKGSKNEGKGMYDLVGGFLHVQCEVEYAFEHRALLLVCYKPSLQRIRQYRLVAIAFHANPPACPILFNKSPTKLSNMLQSIHPRGNGTHSKRLSTVAQ